MTSIGCSQVVPHTVKDLSDLPGAGSPGYIYLGCFKDYIQGSPYANGMRTLPVEVVKSGGWTVDQWAVLARNKGYAVFALQFYSSCFMGSVADVARMIAMSENVTDAECSAIHCVQGGPCPPSRNNVFFLEGMPHFKTFKLTNTVCLPNCFPQEGLEWKESHWWHHLEACVAENCWRNDLVPSVCHDSNLVFG
jgi:hypothetical protein